MALPDKYLQPGEELVLDLRPHWWHLAVPVAGLVAAIILGSFSLTLSQAPLKIGAGVVLLLALAYFAFHYAKWARTNFAVTSERVIHRSGVIARQGTEMPLEKINTVDFSQSILERLIGAGDLLIESGSERGVTTFSDVRHPQMVQQELTRLMDAKEQRGYAIAAPAVTPVSAADELKKWHDLMQQGVITADQFAAKRAELLGNQA